MAKSFLNNPAYASYPRGIRNNNPANLILTSENWQGKIPNSQNTDGHFEQFKELRYGIRAMMRNMINKINGGINTVDSLISVLSPSFENHTGIYIQNVAKALGILPSVKLEITQETIIALCKIIATVENGKQYADLITESDYQEAIAILGMPLKKKAVTAC